jgi:hypothetical protein
MKSPYGCHCGQGRPARNRVDTSVVRLCGNGMPDLRYHTVEISSEYLCDVCLEVRRGGEVTFQPKNTDSVPSLRVV